MSFSARVPQWNALASRILGWRPAEFWQATPAELASALSDPFGGLEAAPPNRDQIQQLMERDAHG